MYACDSSRGCTDTRKRVCTKVDSGRKISCRTGESNLRRRRAGLILYQLSYIPTYFAMLPSFHSETGGGPSGNHRTEEITQTRQRPQKKKRSVNRSHRASSGRTNTAIRHYTLLIIIIKKYNDNNDFGCGFLGECSTIHSSPALFCCCCWKWKSARAH